MALRIGSCAVTVTGPEVITVPTGVSSDWPAAMTRRSRSRSVKTPASFLASVISRQPTRFSRITPTAADTGECRSRVSGLVGWRRDTLSILRLRANSMFLALVTCCTLAYEGILGEDQSTGKSCVEHARSRQVASDP